MTRWLVIGVAALALCPVARAQKAPRIGYVYPAGGQQGTTFEVTVGGQGLTGASDVYFSGSGAQATVIAHERPLSGKETELLRDKLKHLQEQRQTPPSSASPAPTPEADKEIAGIKEKLAKFGNGPQFNVAIAENVRLRVTMAPDATLGDQEIRLATPNGLSNPLVFCVGQLPEFSKPAARGSLKAEIDSKPRGNRKRENSKVGTAKEEITAVALPAVINGQILPGEVDRFRFAARRGQRVLVAVSARKLIPYLPDAVPGWFQATLAIYDPDGHELAFAGSFRFDPDPVLCYEFPKAGEYEIEIKDSLYRGREDFVYRITVGELPFVTGIFPLGGAVGAQSTVEIHGWNLPAARVSADFRNGSPGIHPLVTARGRLVSNFVPFAVDTLPETFEKEPNNDAAGAQRVVTPIIVNGRIDKPGDTDVFRFEGRAGSQIVAEICARRLNSPLDSVLKLTDAAGKQLAFNDDNEDKGSGLTTHQADSRLSATLPADGAYFIHVSDAQHNGGPECAYRLRISSPHPDFALRIVPSSINGRAGDTVPITVYALRHDGYAGEIAVSLKGAPEGFKLNGGNVPANKDQAKLTVTLPATPSEEPLALNFEGRASIDGREVFHPAVPAEDMQQAFAYHHLVTAKELKAVVAGRLFSKGPVTIASNMPVKIPAGGAASVQVAGSVGTSAEQLQLELSDPPGGIAIKKISTSSDGVTIEIGTDPANVLVGEKGTLIVQAFSASPGKKHRIPLGALPAIPFEIVAQ